MEHKLELWAGIECTANRVQDTYFDQIKWSGHDARPDDLRRFAALGVRTLRFPILWERCYLSSGELDWSWADERLALARELKLEPIVGFVHHGSGPPSTNLLDPEFPHKLGAFASQFAQRYPWVKRFTPINEPLTTARFSGLYGVWYPHHRNDRSFLQILLNECLGIAESMRAIREFIPDAELIQTEDMGRVFSTPFLAYQARFENRRRWLSFDLLFGRVTQEHPLWDYMLEYGIDENQLIYLSENPCPPAVLGINHYLTSNRFLDERFEFYPPHARGGNTRHRYADIEAVRVGGECIYGVKELLREVWQRYRQPLAITECHVGCTRDEQLRWLNEVWQCAKELKAEDVDIRAVTVWSLLGSFDWNSLVTRADGFYESGVFDVRGGLPRPTALAKLVKAITDGEDYDHPALDTLGWWHRQDRVLYPTTVPANAIGQKPSLLRQDRSRQILITGSPGTLATAFGFICERRGLKYRLLSHKDLDIADYNAVQICLRELKPWAVINAAGYVKVDEAEKNQELCFRANVLGAEVLSQLCAAMGIQFLTYSTDLVFNGQQNNPYNERDFTAPLNIYGQSKALAENRVNDAHKEALIIRTSAFFGPWDEYNFLVQSLRKLSQGREIGAYHDQVVSPTYVPHLVDGSLDLLMDGEAGIWHLANHGVLSWYEFACEAAKLQGLNTQLIQAIDSSNVLHLAKRPKFSALGSERGQLLPKLDCALDRFMTECRVAIQ
jgi:dTDP-4-dehydrorhamnose reductase